MNKIMKYQIIKPLNMDWKTFGDILYKLQNETRFTKNKTIALYNDWTNYCLEEKKKTGEYPKLNDIHGYKIFSGYAYDKIKNDIVYMNTGNFTTSIRNICVTYDTKKKDIICGKAAVPNANKNQPIDLHNKNIALNYNSETNNYILTLSLLSNKGKKEMMLDSGMVDIVIKCGEKSSKDILDRCLLGNYKICASQILHQNGKYFINLCYNFEAQQEELDADRIMGIDLGVAIPAYMAFNFNNKLRASIKDDRIIQNKIHLDKELSNAKKQMTFTNNGHGRNNKMRVYNRYSNTSHNLSQTVNHEWSKYIVEQAVKNKCATIQMEDLSGINSESKFLKNWTYYDLQQKIIYKAKEKGIEVVKINPKYTSQRCSKCGCIHAENRPNQKTFKCIECGFEENADFNAARNISTKGIEDLIAAKM